jgi:hypothetical protein
LFLISWNEEVMSDSQFSVFESYRPIAKRREEGELKVREMLAKARGNLTADFSGGQDSAATLLWKLRTGHTDIRGDKVNALRAAINSREYTMDEKLDGCLDKLLDDILAA